VARLTSSVLFVGLVALASCGTDPALEKRVADLETQVKDLNAKVDAAKTAGPGGAPAVDPERDRAAGDLLRLASEAAEAGNYDEAKAKLADLTGQYGDTKAAKRSARLSSELAVIGIDAGDIKVEKWFTGSANMNDGKATMLVFWETWCPHCQEEVPKLEDTYTKYKSKGLNIVAVTTESRGATDDTVNQFISEHKLTFPIAKDSGDMSQRFGVQGIPAAAIVKDGKVVWRGHPARIDDSLLTSILDGTPRVAPAPVPAPG
jgi:thiol-disulfide isomerase/thioredoxin